jgi:hypothetical protein
MNKILPIVLFFIAHHATAADLETLKAQCAEYGFARGTDGNASCVMKLDAERRSRDSESTLKLCANLEKEIEYWCSNAPAQRGMSSLGALNCAQKNAERKRHCQ